jgi:selenocysteine-specific elongation factor
MHFILATAGHVDHGKSALVKALTGIDPDRLPEEKERGITIDLGFADLELLAPDTFTKPLNIGIIDVPGHEDFVKNMVAGVGSIDLVLLAVAADDGWMPQTEEHLQILTYLGVQRAIVALTKIDLAKSEDSVESAVRSHLRETPFANAAIVKTSVVSGGGIDQLRTQLAREFSSIEPQRDIGKPRLYADRAFTLRGIGTVVTGTLLGGKFKRGQVVVVQPGNIPARIRTIQSHNRELAEIGPGTRTALNIPDVPIAQRKGERGVRRGDVITLAQFGQASATVDALLTRSSRLPRKTRALTHGAPVHVHHGGRDLPARIFFLDVDELHAGESAITQLRFEAGVFVFAGDRFVVRDSSEQHTLAGGVVLNPDATTKNFRSEPQRRLLSERARPSGDSTVFVATQLAHDRVAKRSSILVKSGFSADEIEMGVAQLRRHSRAIVRGEIVADSEWWNKLRALAAEAIDVEHKAHPNHVGLALAQLRNAVATELLAPEIFDTLVGDLCQSGFVRTGERLKRATHQPALPPQLQSAGGRMRAALAANPFDPPSRKELAPDSLSEQALRFLRDTGEVIEIGDEVVLMSESFARMKSRVLDFIREKGDASVSELRQMLGSSRRIVIPLLEHLDRESVTLRLGERRVLGARAQT